jgi:hypothetical protein
MAHTSSCMALLIALWALVCHGLPAPQPQSPAMGSHVLRRDVADPGDLSWVKAWTSIGDSFSAGIGYVSHMMTFMYMRIWSIVCITSRRTPMLLRACLTRAEVLRDTSATGNGLWTSISFVIKANQYSADLAARPMAGGITSAQDMMLRSLRSSTPMSDSAARTTTPSTIGPAPEQ